MRLTKLSSIRVRLLHHRRLRPSRLPGLGMIALIALVTALSATTKHSAAQSPTTPKDHFAAPNGTPSGNGTMQAPWDLITALSHPPAVRPGDTIWVREGVYAPNGRWTSNLTGTPAAPVVVRAYPGERVQMLGGMRIFGDDAWYCGLEHTYAGTESRVSAQSGSDPTDQPARGQVAVYGDRVKLINSVVHDLNEGIDFFGFDQAIDAEVYGAILFNNGWQGTDRGNGSGMYIQSGAGTKWITDVISFNNFSIGMKGYGRAAEVNGLLFDGVMSFSAGAYAVDTPSQGARVQNLLVTSEDLPADGIVVRNGSFYQPPVSHAVNLMFGNNNAKGLALQVTGNYIAGGVGISVNRYETATVTGNTVYGRQTDPTVHNSGLVGVQHDGAIPPRYLWDRNAYFDGILPWAEDGRRYSFGAAGASRAWVGGRFTGWLATTGYDARSTYTVGRPTATKIIVRPNRREIGRAHVAVYNWGGASTVQVDASAVGLRAGDQYEVLDVQNYFGGPVATGTFGGRAIPVPMNLTTVARATGMTWQPAHTAPEFAVFVIRPVRRLYALTPPAAGVAGGNKASVSVTVTPPAPEGGAIVALTSSAPGLAQPPAFVKVPAGASSASFDVSTSIVDTDTSVSLTAFYMGNSRNADLVVRPLLGSVTVSPYRVVAGLPVSGTVTMNGVALPGGTIVALSSDKPFATVPATVTVPEGATSASFTVNTDPALTADSSCNISGTLGAVIRTCELTVEKRALSGFSISPLTISSGTAGNGIVAINGRASSRGAVIAMSSSKPSVAWAPGRVTVAPNAMSVSFPVSAGLVTSDTPVTITATYNGTTKSVDVVVDRYGLTAIGVTPGRIMAGDKGSATVTLAGPAKPGGTVVALESSKAALTVPASVTVPAGASSVTFPVATDAASADCLVTLTASFAGVTRTCQVTVKARALYAVRLTPATVTGGSVATGTVVLNAPALPGGAVVTLISSDPAAEVPATVTVPAGAVTATFSVAAKTVAASTTLSVTGSCGGVSKAAILTVVP